MNITKLNEIFSARGSDAALASARAAQMDDWIIRALENGTWEPGKKSEPKPAPRYAEMPAVRRPASRLGKTAKSGGLAASLQRKKARSEADRELRNRMKSPKGSK